MKSIIAFILIFAAIGLKAQTTLTPQKNAVQRKWIMNTSYQMIWYAVKDTMKFEIGKTNTDIKVYKDKLVVVTNISMNQSKQPWVDSTIANMSDLSPVYHSSYNAQRDMVLNFGKVVKGFYNDKINHQFIAINDTTQQGYFDSNLYPTIITWLSLHENYKQDISIYEFKPGSKSGVLKASVHDVKTGNFSTQKSGTRKVWIVTVSDEMGGTGNGVSTYYIDVADRRLWKQEIQAGGRRMEMLLVEM